MKPAIKQSYERYIAKLESELAGCTEPEREAVLRRNLEIEHALLAKLEGVPSPAPPADNIA